MRLGFFGTGEEVYRRAEPAPQSLEGRATFIGGYPLALDGTGALCPASANVACDKGYLLDQQCCASGQKCILTSSASNHCCPTEADCTTAAENLPSCGNSSWNMFVSIKPKGYFCCEQGQIGMYQATGGYGGLCQAADREIPASLIATAAKQLGVATGTGATGTPSPSTSPSTTSTRTPANPTTSNTSSGNPTSSTTTTSNPNSNTNPNSSNSNSNSNSINNNTSSGLRTAEIIGIVIGILGLFVLAGIAFLLFRRRRKYEPAPTSPPPTTAYGQSGGAGNGNSGQQTEEEKIFAASTTAPVRPPPETVGSWESRNDQSQATAVQSPVQSPVQTPPPFYDGRVELGQQERERAELANEPWRR